MHEPTLFESGADALDPDAETGPSGPVSRVRLTIAYDGTDFRGLAPNPGVRTVVGEIQRVLGAAYGNPPDIVMSGRTDAGVHASEQVLSFDLPIAELDDDTRGRLARMINARLGPEIAVIDVAPAAPDFSARFDADGRAYRYRVLNRPTPDPTLARYTWHVPEPLNLAVMRLACDPLVGEHDFSSFCRRPKPGPGQEPVSLVRRVTKVSWTDRSDGPVDGLLEFAIEGSAFCHQMVRSIVGFHVAVGRGKRTAGELRSVLGAKDRQAAEQPAPPHGLHLVRVDYPQA